MTESIGAKLKQAREQRRLTLGQISETTKIRQRYLEALENDDLSAIPSAAQARGFLHIYADSLGLNLADLIPTAPPAETPAPPQPAASSPDRSTAGAEEPVSTPQPARPNLLASLRQRFDFARRGGPKTSDTPSSEVTPVVESQPAVTVDAGAESLAESVPTSQQIPESDHPALETSKTQGRTDVKKNAAG